MSLEKQRLLVSMEMLKSVVLFLIVIGALASSAPLTQLTGKYLTIIAGGMERRALLHN